MTHDAADKLGAQAFRDGLVCIPYNDSKLKALLKSSHPLVIGETQPILDSWMRAWHRENLAAIKENS